MMFFRIHVVLARLRSLTTMAHLIPPVVESDIYWCDDPMPSIIEDLRSLDKWCEDTGMKESRYEIERAIRRIEDDEHPSTRLDVIKAVNKVINLIQDQVRARTFLFVPDETVRLMSDHKPFGDAVWLAFPEAITDAEEAAKCLAFQRATACTFHCMRVVDLGIKQLLGGFRDGDAFLSEQHRRVWSSLIRRIRQEAQKHDRVIAPAWIGRQHALNRIAESVNLMAEASRNPTMHSDINYSVEQATDVFHTTGSLMRRLAEDLKIVDGQEAADEDDVQGRGNPRPEA